MKIQTDQLTALRQTTDSSSESKKVSDGFASLLAKEVGTQAAQDSGLTAPVLSGLNALDLSDAQNVDTAATSEATDAEASTMDSMNSLLDQWDDYTTQLASSSEADSLKKAYGVLNNIANGVQQLKNNLPAGSSSTLGSMINEMDVLTTTEQIKFNRGDYI
jgi:hypothetical protein